MTRSLALPSLLLLSGCSLVFAPSNYSSGADLGAIDGGSTDLGPTDARIADLGVDDAAAPTDLGADSGPPGPLWPQCSGASDVPTPLRDVYGDGVILAPGLAGEWTGVGAAMFGLLPNDFDLGGVPGQLLTAVSIAADTDPDDATADSLYVALGGNLGRFRVLRLQVDALGSRAIAEERTYLVPDSSVTDISITTAGGTVSIAFLAGGSLHLYAGRRLADLIEVARPMPTSASRVAHAGMVPIYLDADGVLGGDVPVVFSPLTPFDPPTLIGSHSPLAFSRVADGRWLAMNTNSGANTPDVAGADPGWLTGATLVTATGSTTREHALRQRVADQFELAFQGTVTCSMAGCPFTAPPLARSVEAQGYLVAVAEAGVHRRTDSSVTDFIVVGTRTNETATDGTEVRVFPFVQAGVELSYLFPQGITIASGTTRATGGVVGTLRDVESAVTTNSRGVGVFAVALVDLAGDPAPHAYLSGFRACGVPPPP